jgi:hypothetical protein
MRARSIFVIAALLGWCGDLPSAHGAADLTFRESRLRHVCEDGPTPGAVCCFPNDDCGVGGACVVDSIGKASGTITIVIDDDVSQLDGTTIPGRRIKALTVILETKGKHGVVLAQTFQRLDASSLTAMLDALELGTADEFGFAVDETLLKLSTDTSGTGIPLDISWLIYRTLDPETLKRMRTNALLDPNGPELLVIQPSKLKLARFADEVGSSFSTVLRVKMNAFFVAPKQPPC